VARLRGHAALRRCIAEDRTA